MAYNVNDPTLLKHLIDLGNRVKAVTSDHETRVKALEDVGAEKNVIVGIQKNGADVAVDSGTRKVNISVPTKTSELENDSNWVDETTIDSKIDAKVAGALIPSGSVAFASLPALTKENVNKLYNVTDAFTTSADFVEGAGVNYPAGTNVAIINVGTAETPSYKYDAYTGVIDLSGYANRVTGGTENNFAALDGNGNLKDSGSKASDFMTATAGANKADKAVPAAAGNFAALDASGNLIDSGKKATDFLTEHQDISGKLDKLTGANEGEIVLVGANGTIKSSGVDFATDTEVAEALETIFPTKSNT